jgi:hypothetical protein
MCVDVQVSPQKKKKTVFSLLGTEPLVLYFKSFFFEEIYFYLNYFFRFPNLHFNIKNKKLF